MRRARPRHDFTVEVRNTTALLPVVSVVLARPSIHPIGWSRWLLTVRLLRPTHSSLRFRRYPDSPFHRFTVTVSRISTVYVWICVCV